jgi:CheY-like chemotaxis protein
MSGAAALSANCLQGSSKRRTADRVAEKQTSIVNSHTGFRPRTLVADDTPIVARNVMEVLKDAGADVMNPASDGAQALRLWAEHRPDLAVLDFQMPQLTGLQVVKAIRAAERQAPELARCYVVILSSHTEPAIAQQCLVDGADRFLNKPFGFEHLRDIVALVAGHAARPVSARLP